MNSTLFSKDGFRFHFFSREETRAHIDVHHAEGDVKVWMEPTIELARHHGLKAYRLRAVMRIVHEHAEDILKAWREPFPR